MMPNVELGREVRPHTPGQPAHQLATRGRGAKNTERSHQTRRTLCIWGVTTFVFYVIYFHVVSHNVGFSNGCSVTGLQKILNNVIVCLLDMSLLGLT